MGAPNSESVTFRHNQEGGPRSLYGHVVALGKAQNEEIGLSGAMEYLLLAS
jgi:hypothetical protein